jgi:His/Glu/Gln/Arg/opine family amino acid ABC transporter permease subunit
MLTTLVEIFATYKSGFMQGLLVTLRLCMCIWFIGIVLGSLLGILGSIFKRFGNLSSFVSTVVSGVPIVVLLYWLYYPVQQQLELDIEPFTIAVCALAFVNTIMVADLVRDAINSLPKQYIMAAKVSGIPAIRILTRIKIPLILKQLIGPVLLVQVSMLHNSIFASLINVDDIFRQIQRINAMVYKPIELYTALAIFFIVITVPLTLFARFLKKKYAKDYSER